MEQGTLWRVDRVFRHQLRGTIEWVNFFKNKELYSECDPSFYDQKNCTTIQRFPELKKAIANPMKNIESEKVTLLDMIVFVLSVYVLLALIAYSFFEIADETKRLILILDDVVCFVFLYDFFHRFAIAGNKKLYLKWGWIDFVSSIPVFHFLRYGRLVRMLRIILVLRAFRSAKYIVKHIFKTTSEISFTSIAFMILILIVFGSVAILQVENAPDSNIKTAEDAIWWVIVAVMTVGFGDKYPVTTEGRIIGAFIMIIGVGLFGTFTGYIASWFINNKKNS